MTPVSAIAGAIDALRAAYGEPQPLELSAFEWILYENASYLVDDERRWATFSRLREAIGVRPDLLLRTDVRALAEEIAGGGMKPLMRAAKLHECAEIALTIGVDRLNQAVAERPAEGKRLLRRFPGIGEPSADKILLFCGSVPSLAPDSNALRVLVRLGYADDADNYAKQYRTAVANAFVAAADALAGHLLLRRHGQEVCKRAASSCEICVLRSSCAWYRAH